MSTYTTSLSSFKCYDSFNLFLFSRTNDNQTHFLLRRKPQSSDFIHFRGKFANKDPSILLALAKKFVRKTNGLLCSENFQYFLKEDPLLLLDSQNVVVDNCPKFTRQPKTMSPAMNDISKLICESPYFFQDMSNTATYFVEIPMLDLEKLGDFAQNKGISHEFKYFTMEEMLGENYEDINPHLKTILHENCDLMDYIRTYIINREPIETLEYYGIICCEMFLKTYMLHALHFPVFKKHGESWRFYRAFEKDLPTDEDLSKLKGIVIPGSSFSAYNAHVDWYPGLFAVIRKVHDLYPHINLLGICFGAQVIAQALGGRVEKMSRDFIDGGEVLNVKPEFYDLPFVRNSGLNASKQLVIAQAHNDHIVELPPTAIHYASSENTNVEIFTIKNHILGFQGHPDYNEVMVVRSNYKQNNLGVRNYSKYEEERIKSKFPNPLTQEEVLKVCFNFLKQKL